MKILEIKTKLRATCVNEFEEQQCEQAGEIAGGSGTSDSNPNLCEKLLHSIRQVMQSFPFLSYPTY